MRADRVALAGLAALGAAVVGLGVWVAQYNLFEAGHSATDLVCSEYGDHVHIGQQWLILWP